VSRPQKSSVTAQVGRLTDVASTFTDPARWARAEEAVLELLT
jgi:hypothetical protein